MTILLMDDWQIAQIIFKFTSIFNKTMKIIINDDDASSGSSDVGNSGDGNGINLLEVLLSLITVS